MRSPRRFLLDHMARIVAKPRKRYHRFGANDPVRLKRNLLPGDVLLIDGDQRISQAIKTLTMSSWSHNCVYIGDELLRRNHPYKESLLARYGHEANYMVIEALIEEGVVASPVTKYIDFNLRICRPHGLTNEDRAIILDDLIDKLGLHYDLKNFFDLARYLLPLHLVPARFREDALLLGSGRPTETICSTLTAAAFQKVGFPILPDYRPAKPKTPGAKFRAALLGRPARRAYTGLFLARHPTLVVPRDFDLSPYFDIVKFNVIADGFDYKKMKWAPAQVR